ncbi:MAG: TetR/AcrR family transcriptional regulator [Methanolobus sp.]
MKKQIEDKNSPFGSCPEALYRKVFHGTSTAQISKEAGVATGTLFNYFPYQRGSYQCPVFRC